MLIQPLYENGTFDMKKKFMTLNKNISLRNYLKLIIDFFFFLRKCVFAFTSQFFNVTLSD